MGRGFLRAHDIFPTLLILASLPGKNSRLRRSDSFPGGRFVAAAGDPEKISNVPFPKPLPPSVHPIGKRELSIFFTVVTPAKA
jgi:hypothetical protein